MPATVPEATYKHRVELEALEEEERGPDSDADV